MKILLVEDDELLGDGIRAGLILASFAVDWVRRGDQALAALTDQPYDACVLDLGLPGKDGLAVLRQLRRSENALPVLVLTARDSREDKITGLDSGADDYMTKPYYPYELKARIRSGQRVLKLEDDLKTATSQLLHSEKLAALGTLAAGIAHDFNNQLGVVMGNVELGLPEVCFLLCTFPLAGFERGLQTLAIRLQTTDILALPLQAVALVFHGGNAGPKDPTGKGRSSRGWPVYHASM